MKFNEEIKAKLRNRVESYIFSVFPLKRMPSTQYVILSFFPSPTKRQQWGCPHPLAFLPSYLLNWDIQRAQVGLPEK